MSVCNIIRDLMPLYRDCALSADSRRAVREHLLACGDCRAYLRELRDEHRRHAAPPPPHHADYTALLRRMRRREQKEANLRTGLIAAALLIQLAATAVHLTRRS